MAENAELVQVLETTSTGDQNLLLQASQYLEQYTKSDFASFVTNLSFILKNPGLSNVARLQAALQLKNQVYSKDSIVNSEYTKRWLSLAASTRDVVKSNCLEALGTEQCRPSQAAQCVGCLALCEVPNRQWTDVIDTLVNKVLAEEDGNPLVREASLDAIGYICHDMPVQFITPKSNEILTAIIYGMTSTPGDVNLKVAATNALLNSIEFTRNNFEVDAERNYIMKVVCEATQLSDIRVRVVALQVLVKIATLYYTYLNDYMEQALFLITQEAIRSTTPGMALQGIEFWSTICDEELDIMAEMEQARMLNDNSMCTRTLRNFASIASGFIVPDLLERLKEQSDGDESDDDDEWNPCKAAGVCLTLMAEVCGDRLIEPVMTFVNGNIGSADWRARDAAVMAFGSIVVDNPGENLTALAEHAPTALLPMTSDTSVVVRDTVAWALGRLCDNIPSVCLSEKYVNALVQTLLNALDDKPRVAHNVCWALANLLRTAGNDSNPLGDAQPTTYALSPHFAEIVRKLLTVTTRSDGNQNHLRSAAYEALISAIQSSAKDCYGMLKDLNQIILSRLEASLARDGTGISAAERAEMGDTQVMLCTTLQALIQKLNKVDCQIEGDRIVVALMQIISDPASSSNGAQEDAVGALSMLCVVLKDGFEKYVSALMPYVVTGLANHVCKQAFVLYVGLYSDICRWILGAPPPHADDVIKVLFNCLNDTSLDIELRPQVLSLIGDMAATDSRWFHKYIPPVMKFLEQAGSASIDTANDPDLLDYKNSLYESCLLALSGIVQGLQTRQETGSLENMEALALLLQYVEFMVGFVTRCTADTRACSDSVLQSAIGLIGDLAKLFGPIIADHFKNQAIGQLLMRARDSPVPKTRQIAHWTAGEISRRLTMLDSVSA